MSAGPIVAGVAGAVGGQAAGALLDGNDETALIAILGKMTDQLIAANRYASNQKERLLRPVDVRSPVNVDGAWRGEYVLVSGAVAGDVLGIKMGTAVLFDWVMGSSDAKEIDCPVLFNNTVQVVNLTNPSDDTYRAWLFVHWDQPGDRP